MNRVETAVERATRLAAKRQRSSTMKWKTRTLGLVSVGAVAVLAAAELNRIWRLGRMPEDHGGEASRYGPIRAVVTVREGYRVSSTRENATFNMLFAFVIAFATARTTTHYIRLQGTAGPFRDLSVGGRHIHHFVPGALIALGAGGVAIATDSPRVRRVLAIPYGVGVALVLDEAALLLELEDVYWSDEGVLSVQVVFAVMALLAAITYALQVRRQGEPGAEADWVQAASAWRDLDAHGTARRGH